MATETTLYITKSKNVKVVDLPFYGINEIDIFADYRHDIDLMCTIHDLKGVDCFDYLELSLCELKMLKFKAIYKLDEFGHVIDDLINLMEKDKEVRLIVGYC